MLNWDIVSFGYSYSGGLSLNFAHLSYRGLRVVFRQLDIDKLSLLLRLDYLCHLLLLLLLHFSHDVGDFWVSERTWLGLGAHSLLVKFDSFMVVNCRLCSFFLGIGAFSLVDKDCIQSFRLRIFIKCVTLGGNVIWRKYPRLCHICYILQLNRFLRANFSVRVSKSLWVIVLTTY